MTVIGVTGDRAFLRRLNALPSGQVLYGAQLYDCAIVIALAAEAARSTDPAVVRSEAQRRPVRRPTVLDVRRLPGQARGRGVHRLPGPARLVHVRRHRTPPPRPGSRSPTWPTANFVVAKTVNLDITAMQAAHAAELATAAAVQTTRIQQASPRSGSTRARSTGRRPTPSRRRSPPSSSSSACRPPVCTTPRPTPPSGRSSAPPGTAVNDATISLQQALRDLGYYNGPIDGTYSAATVAAVRSFQASIGVPQTGIVDAATLQGGLRAGRRVRAAAPAREPTTVPTRRHRRSRRRRRRRPSRPPSRPPRRPRLRRHRRRRRRPGDPPADGAPTAPPAPRRRPRPRRPRRRRPRRCRPRSRLRRSPTS